MPEPLASLLRPKNLDDFMGQKHLVGPGMPLRLALENRQLFSLIFWGPPGVGKTTLARILAKNLNAQFHELSAVSAGKEDIRKIIENFEKTPLLNTKLVIFLDEIHRFNKAQQDFLLPFVESGKITLIGATTENPSFEVISPLLSRCRVFILKELTTEDISQIIDRALKTLLESVIPSKVEGSLANARKKITITSDARTWLCNLANGDARACITMLDNAYTLYGNLKLESLKNALQNFYLRFDKKGEEHYNTISAFIKSMRASNPDAAVYYLARMIEAGEDPLFIARRMLVFASEDIGSANNNALLVANQVFQACERLGYPECRITLSHGVIYLATSQKNRTAYDAIETALADIKATGNLPIPLNLRNAPTKLMKQIGYGQGYEMYTKQDLLPEKLKGKKYVKR